MNSKGEFLKQLIDNYNYWLSKNEPEYAKAYLVMVNSFSVIEEKNKDE